MESSGYRHRRSPSSDRFLDVFSFSPPSSAGAGGGEDELNEAEVFWTNDFTEPNENHHYDHHHNHRPPPRLTNNFQNSTSSGILAALPDSDNQLPVLCRKPSISATSSSKAIPTIPRPSECSRKFQDQNQNQNQNQLRRQSAPMKVPVLAKAMSKNKNGMLADVADVDDIDDDEMLPPHEIVARGSGVSPKTTFSVLEGVGRTLKGRDLRQVRNAIWRKTGFLD
ncbi:hypothetical protein FCV25MIE_20531 [Fagus crenata]